MKTQLRAAYFIGAIGLTIVSLVACGGGGTVGLGAGAASGALQQGAAQQQSMDRSLAFLAASSPVHFPLTVSPGAKVCIPKASGEGTISSVSSQAERLHITVSGLPHSADFDVFIIQVPNKPFGLAWYQGDIDTNALGNGSVDFIGRFSIETFIVAPGVAPAPLVFTSPPFPDASSNPKTPPVQLYHVGIWFNSPSVAAKAGCANTVTPFNGTHNAGIQALNTGTFPINAGPLRSFH